MRYSLVLLAFANAFLPAALSARPLELDDMYRIRELAEVQVSPGGEWVAYTVSAIDRDEDESTSDLWMSRWDGSANLQLTDTPQSESYPRWSPDGNQLAFLSDRADEDKGAQLWLLDMRGGEAKQLTQLEHAVSDFAWSPDGTRIVLVVDVAPPKPDEEKPEPIVVNRYWFKEDVTGYLGVARSHLFLVETDDGNVSQLTDEAYHELQPSWSPDGERIAFVSKREGDMDRHDNWDVFVMDAEPGASVSQVTQNPGADGDAWDSDPPRWSPDGDRLAYLRGGKPEDLWYALTQIATIDAEGGTENLPTEALDRNSRQPRWSADGSRIYFLLEDDQSVQLAEVRLRDNRVERLTAPGRVVHEYDVNADGRIAMIVSTPEQPAEVWKLERGRMQQLSRQNDDLVEEVDLLSAQTIRFDSADGLEIHGMVMRPAAAKAPLPLVLRIHGGPVSQYQYEFDFEWQLFAANGYLVAGINPRGSTGRGEEFQKMLFADWGHADVPDILAATDHLVASHGADPDRLGVGGWSYGGILTNYVIASTDRFKAAISGSGMSNMLGGYGIDQYVVEWEKELGTPWENTDAWMRLSYPFLEADRIKTPTLFMCGAADFNVPLAASEQMYQALRSLDVATELIIYPDQYHSLTRASFRHDKRRRYLEWYDRYLKP
jgi:dipeptidyl aminopeptidase/acylaminoacyl peptidase